MSTETLQKRPLGSTGLEVSPVCIGCAPLGSMPDTFDFAVPEERALETIREVLRSPINFVDTAASYGDGESERRIGIVLREMGGIPDGYVVATKADRSLQTGDFSGDQMKRSVERSLRLLGLDTLQLVYLHDPEHSTWEEVMSPGGAVETLQQLRDEGVIQHLGMAGGPVDLMARYIETEIFEALITHNRYTLINRNADYLITTAHDRGVAVMNAAPYGSGILAKGPDAYPRYAYQSAPEDIVRRAQEVADICKRYDVPLAAAALQFSLRDPRITSTIVGMTRPERIAQTIELAQYPVPDELLSELAAYQASTENPEE